MSSEAVSQDALMTLLKKREKEIAKLQEKVKQGETLTARQKLLLKDRRVFLKFCKLVGVKDTELIFESAMAKEIPIELDELAQPQVIDIKMTADHFREFTEMVLGQDAKVSTQDCRIDMRLLRQAWTAKCEASNESGSRDAISFTVHEQLRVQAERIEHLESVLEKSSSIPSLIDRGEMISVAVGTARASTRDFGCESRNIEDGQVTDLRSQTEALKKSIAESETAKLRRESEWESRISSLRKELQVGREESSHFKARVSQLEAERNRYVFVEEMALKQAERDAEVRRLKDELASLKQMKQAKVETTTEKTQMTSHIFLKLLAYAISGEFDKMKALIPIARELFDLTGEDTAELERLCQGASGTSVSSWLGLS